MPTDPLDRMTKAETFAAGVEAGRAEAADGGPTWTAPSFALVMLAEVFAIGASGYVLWRTSEPSLELVLALIAAVSSIPAAYLWQRKPEAEG